MVTGIGKLVEIDDELIAVTQPVENKIRADKTGTAGNKNGHNFYGVWVPGPGPHWAG